MGPTSSGKTTTVNAYIRKYPEVTRAYDTALMASERFLAYLEGTANSPVDYLPFEVEALLVRFLQNLDCVGACIADQSLHSIWAYARAAQMCGLISDRHYQTIVALALTLDRLAPRPQLAIHFRCDSNEARRRLEERERPHELRLCTINFLNALDLSYIAIVEELKDTTKVVKLDTSEISQIEALCLFERIIKESTQDTYFPVSK